MAFNRHDLVRKDDSFLFRCFLISLPLSCEIVHVSGLHPGLHADERYVPNRSVMIGTIDLGIDRDGSNQQHHRKRTYSYTLSFHFGLLAHTRNGDRAAMYGMLAVFKP